MLLQYIRAQFPWLCVEPVPRKYWNEHAGRCATLSYNLVADIWLIGLEFIDQLCVEDEERPAMLVSVSNK
jgi:DNA mismatch repair protein MSH4